MMNPLISIWTQSGQTIDALKNSRWASRQGFIFYIISAINSAAQSRLPSFIESKLGTVALIISLALVGGYLYQLICVNVIFYFGKTWNGQATKRNIDTVIALCLIPEAFKFIYLSVRFVLQQDIRDVQINNLLIIICFFLSVRILLIGLTRVQKFGYGISVVNILLPQLAALILFYSILGL
jgi:hypothetical protein